MTRDTRYRLVGRAYPQPNRSSRTVLRLLEGGERILGIRAASALVALVLLVVLPAMGTEEGSTGTLQEDATTSAYVTFRVETSEGDWIRFKTRANQMATLEILRTGERFGLTPRLGFEPEEVRIELVRLDQPGQPSSSPVERVTGKVGFPSFLARASLRQITVEAVELEHRSVPVSRAEASQLWPMAPSPSLELGELCCVTCNGVTGCGCYVAASCGSCCDCCGPQEL